MGWGSYGPDAQKIARYVPARHGGRVSRRDFNRMQGQISRKLSSAFAVDVLGESDLSKALLEVDEKIRQKIVQNAIKPLVRLARKEWRSAIRSATVKSKKKSAFRRRYGAGLRASLAKSIKTRQPSGSGRKSLRGYVSLGGHVSKSGAVTNAGQAYWMEYGTKPHALGKGSRLKKGRQSGRMHPGTKPITNVRARFQALEPVALRMFEEAIAEGIRTGGKAVKGKVIENRARLLA